MSNSRGDMVNQSSSSSDSRGAIPGECNEILEPPFKKMNTSGSRDETLMNSALPRETKAANPRLAPLESRFDRLLLLLDNKNFEELKSEIKELKADAGKCVSINHEVYLSRELQPSISDLKEELDKTKEEMKCLKKRNSMLEVAFQNKEKVATLEKWVSYLEEFPEFNTPEKLYKAYLDASIQAAAAQKLGKDYIEQIERHFKIINEDFQRFYSQAISLVPAAEDRLALEKRLSSSQDTVQVVRRIMFLLFKKMAKENSMLKRNLPPLATNEYELIENARDMALWKAKAENLEETLRLTMMDFNLEPSYRILEPRVNPVSTDMLAKEKYLKLLKLENERLLRLLKGNPNLEELVPAESLSRAETQIEQLQSINEDLKKKGERKDAIFKLRAIEFRRIVRDLLGYDIEITNSGSELKITPSEAPFHFLFKFSDVVEKDIGKLIVIGDKPACLDALIRHWIGNCDLVVGFFNSLALRRIEEKCEKILDSKKV
ncbi:coiled-coil domain-containing protein mad1 [Entomophthora muscae]|uniref:Coiled-coil domain-containing protein mad1 n=1 Tax=Entomophthora muscae TaxID=34485 RepID=A0ACC2S1K4_9FUNG|nr:coiled-coil domain-containing protein mad1 [Entomophthora muscae]